MKKYTYEDLDLYGYPIHPKAIERADFIFFWDVVDENAPFGSDEGYEGFVYYWEWEEKNKNRPLEDCLFSFLSTFYSEEYAKELKALSFIPYNDYLLEAENYLESKVFNSLLDLDPYITSIGFGSFVKYGHVHHSFKKHMIYSLERMYKPTKPGIQKFEEAHWLFEKLYSIVGFE